MEAPCCDRVVQLRASNVLSPPSSRKLGCGSNPVVVLVSEGGASKPCFNHFCSTGPMDGGDARGSWLRFDIKDPRTILDGGRETDFGVEGERLGSKTRLSASEGLSSDRMWRRVSRKPQRRQYETRLFVAFVIRVFLKHMISSCLNTSQTKYSRHVPFRKMCPNLHQTL